MIKFIEAELSSTLKIRELELAEFELAFPIVHQLRTHLTLQKFIDLVNEMRATNYQAICLFENEKIVSYAGLANLTNLYYGHHIWVYDLVTDENKRSNGYGKLLLEYIERHAKVNKLDCIALSSRFQLTQAHNFYENYMNYEKLSYVFKKSL